jgi:hypothetical protein
VSGADPIEVRPNRRQRRPHDHRRDGKPLCPRSLWSRRSATQCCGAWA